MTFKDEKYDVFKMFAEQWALVTAGPKDHYNTCTIGWGSLGNIWGHDRDIVTVYVNPDRYTSEFLLNEEYFTVSFFAEEYRDDLQLLGSKSGRDADKIALTKLTPKFLENSVTFEEAELTFVCHKLYQNQFAREGLADDINNGIYKNWAPHYEFIGEIIDVIRK